MTERLPRYRTGSEELDNKIVEMLDAANVTSNRDQLFEIFASVTRLAGDDADRLNLKILASALKEMRDAFNVFAPYMHVPKVTIFGSARTLPEDPLYAQARDIAAELAAQGWMVITGAGPGIMAAGLEGAGRERSFGVSIRLPFEKGANEFIADDPKLVEMRYFFTRKVMLIKESDGFIVLPGGFGTLDEIFELLALVDKGKAEPCPIVLLEVPGGSFWTHWQEFLHSEVTRRGLISPGDDCLFLVTDDVHAATEEVLGFYRNYHSRRFVGERMVMRLKSAPSDEEMAVLNQDFADICVTGGLTRIDTTPSEIIENDHPELPRIAFHFDSIHQARLRMLINRLNNLASAPDAAVPPAR